MLGISKNQAEMPAQVLPVGIWTGGSIIFLVKFYKLDFLLYLKIFKTLEQKLSRKNRAKRLLDSACKDQLDSLVRFTNFMIHINNYPICSSNCSSAIKLFLKRQVPLRKTDKKHKHR